MIASFSSVDTTTFIYENDTSELSGYSGNLLEKLNFWVSKNSARKSWTSDLTINGGYPIFNDN